MYFVYYYLKYLNLGTNGFPPWGRDHRPRAGNQDDRFGSGF